MKEAMLALLVEEPCHGWELHRRLSDALGDSVPPINPGQVYVTLGRLQRAGLVGVTEVEQGSRPDKRVYTVTAAGTELVSEWLRDLSWRRVAPVEFYLKLIAAATSGITDPIGLIDAQRRELLRSLAGLRRDAASERTDSYAALLAEGAALRLEADSRWLDLCERRLAKGNTDDHRA